MGVLILLGFFCGWLSIKHQLLRYRWKAPGRCLLFLGHLFITIWAGVDSQANNLVYVDYLIWNLAMLLVNWAHFVYILCYEKPIKFHPSLDLLWKYMFGPDH